MIPFIIFASLQIGSYFVGGDMFFNQNQEFSLETIKNHTTQYLVGSFILATITAFVFGFSSYFLLSLTGKSKK